MISVRDLSERLIQKSQDFLDRILEEDELDRNLVAFDLFLEVREPMIKVLNEQKDQEDIEEQLEILFKIDDRIRQTLIVWMDETKFSLEDINRQRDSYLKIKRSQGGYNKQQPYSEGYFIDKKK